MTYYLALLALLGNVGLLALLSNHDSGPQQRSGANELEQAGFVVGNWEGVFTIHPSAAIPREAQVPAVMKAVWGPQHAWIESEASMDVPGLGAYVARVIVRFDPQARGYDSFVVNTFGNAGRYAGSLNGGKLVFIGKIGPVTQRVTYASISPNELKFTVEESRDDGAAYLPHSEILWRRQGQ